jgi:hypothetical protein
MFNTSDISLMTTQLDMNEVDIYNKNNNSKQMIKVYANNVTIN